MSAAASGASDSKTAADAFAKPTISGVVKGVLSNGVLAALLRSGKERVCVSLLRGPMIETLMNTGLLPAMMTFEVPGDERLPPPTGSVDESAVEAYARNY